MEQQLMNNKVSIDATLDFLELLINHLEGIKTKGVEKIEMSYVIDNIGITNLPMDFSNTFSMSGWVDLGARSIELKINTPNTKTLEEAIKEQDNK